MEFWSCRKLESNPGYDLCLPGLSDVTYKLIHQIPVETSFCVMTCVASDLGPAALTTLTPAVLGISPSCKHLHLGLNTLPALTQGMINGFSSLTELTAEGAGITSLHSGAFAGLSMLRSLHLSANTMQFDEHAFLGLENLRRLDLSDQQLRSFSPDIWSPLTALQALYVTHRHNTVGAGSGSIVLVMIHHGDPSYLLCALVTM